MGHQIIQQPDGRFCVYSTVVDAFTYVDATREELIELYADDAAAEARARITRIIDHVAAGEARKAYYQFTMTYAEAAAIDAEFRERLA